MQVLVSYDITCSKRRNKVLKELRAEALSYQYSVFEISCSREELHHITHKIDLLIDPDEDKVLFIRLCPNNKPLQLGIALEPISDYLTCFS